MEKKEQDNLLPVPDFTICPKQYCFNWVEKGDLIAKGFHSSLEEATSKMVKVTKSGCGSSLGNCCRDEATKLLMQTKPGQVFKDWYEPCEPALDKAGLPHDYFIAPK